MYDREKGENNDDPQKGKTTKHTKTAHQGALPAPAADRGQGVVPSTVCPCCAGTLLVSGEDV